VSVTDGALALQTHQPPHLASMALLLVMTSPTHAVATPT